MGRRERCVPGHTPPPPPVVMDALESLQASYDAVLAGGAAPGGGGGGGGGGGRRKSVQFDDSVLVPPTQSQQPAPQDYEVAYAAAAATSQQQQQHPTGADLLELFERLHSATAGLEQRADALRADAAAAVPRAAWEELSVRYGRLEQTTTQLAARTAAAEAENSALRARVAELEVAAAAEVGAAAQRKGPSEATKGGDAAFCRLVAERCVWCFVVTLVVLFSCAYSSPPVFKPSPLHTQARRASRKRCATRRTNSPHGCCGGLLREDSPLPFHGGFFSIGSF